MKLVRDEEFNEKIGNIIEQQYFPDKEKIEIMISLLESEADESWELQRTAEKIINSQTKTQTTLGDYLDTHISEEHLNFIKLNQNIQENFNSEHWWIANTNNTCSKEIHSHNLLFQAKGLNDPGFKKPHNWIISQNTRLKHQNFSSSSYLMPEINEKEKIALKLAEKSVRSSAKPSRSCTPRTPSSRVSSIFPIYNYNLPSKRQRENSNQPAHSPSTPQI